MAKQYMVQFGIAGAPSLLAGFSPTFLQFKVVPGGGNTTPPGITEIPTNTGLFYFTYAPLSPISFVIDGGASLTASSRYVVGSLDPADAIDERVTELGSSLVAFAGSMMALGNTLVSIGLTGGLGGSLVAAMGGLADSFGTTLTDPTTVFGYLKRLQENLEGNSIFTKTTGVWAVHSRGNTHIMGPSTYPGSSIQIANKTISDSGSVITKS